MDALREQFEAHYNSIRGGQLPDWVFEQREHGKGYCLMPVQLDWELWQAANAVNADLLEALVALTDSFECYIADNKPQEEWDEYDHMMLPRWQKAREVIKKAKGE